ncbi:MAG: hypothetical protein J5486_08980 [Bacteroidaceae bacterium]|nr:hypothetical protein [Bacteroidaceae bacterium]
MSSCESVSCPLNNTVESVYGFYSSTRDESGNLLGGAAVSIGDSLTVSVAGMDTILVNRLINKSSVSLPVSFYADVDTLVFKFTDAEGVSAFDTVRMAKNNTLHFDDPSCSIHMFHEVLSVESTHQLIDTIIVVNPYINYDGLENFQIYFFTE